MYEVSKEEAIKEIANNPEQAYKVISSLLKRPLFRYELRQGKFPWDYPENWDKFEVRSIATGKCFPMFTRISGN